MTTSQEKDLAKNLKIQRDRYQKSSFSPTKGDQDQAYEHTPDDSKQASADRRLSVLISFDGKNCPGF